MKTERNEPCPCGSGKKYKKCCLLTEDSPFCDHAKYEKQLTAEEKKRQENRIKEYLSSQTELGRMAKQFGLGRYY